MYSDQLLASIGVNVVIVVSFQGIDTCYGEHSDFVKLGLNKIEICQKYRNFVHLFQIIVGFYRNGIF